MEMHKVARDTKKVIVDFFVKHKGKQYFIEYDGQQHFKYIPYFHKGGVVDFEKQQNRDEVLNEFCEIHKNVVTLIRFKYDESFEDIQKQLNFIMN